MVIATPPPPPNKNKTAKTIVLTMMILQKFDREPGAADLKPIWER
jgi:hypothetical protein